MKRSIIAAAHPLLGLLAAFSGVLFAQPKETVPPPACRLIGDWTSPAGKMSISSGQRGLVIEGSRRWSARYDASTGEIHAAYKLTAEEVRQAEDKDKVPQWARDL